MQPSTHTSPRLLPAAMSPELTFSWRGRGAALRLAPAALLLALGACTARDAPEPPAPADSDTLATAPARPDTLTMAMDGQLAQRPAAPIRIEGACPFECCTYGPWTTTEPTAVYAQPDDTTAAPAFTVPAETALDASTGHVLLTRLGRAVARDSVTLYLGYEDTRSAAPGDSLLVLDYVGEGAYRAWHDGGVVQLDGLAAFAVPGEDGPALERLSEPEQQWWARVQTPDGRAGWLWMDRTPSVQGADACGG